MLVVVYHVFDMLDTIVILIVTTLYSVQLFDRVLELFFHFIFFFNNLNRDLLFQLGDFHDLLVNFHGKLLFLSHKIRLMF